MKAKELVQIGTKATRRCRRHLRVRSTSSTILYIERCTPYLGTSPCDSPFLPQPKGSSNPAMNIFGLSINISLGCWLITYSRQSPFLPLLLIITCQGDGLLFHRSAAPMWPKVLDSSCVHFGTYRTLPQKGNYARFGVSGSSGLAACKVFEKRRTSLVMR